MPTITDIARHAGVGIGTVSRVLNHSPQVSVETRRRVLEVIEELDYTPSPAARRLSLGRTQTIAAIVPFVTHPSAVERMRGVVAACRATAYDLIILDIETASHRVERLRALGGGTADGVLIVSIVPADDDIARLQRAGMHAVLVDARHDALPHVVVDDVAGGALATRHLLDLGHTTIAFVGDEADNTFGFTSSTDRHAGYEAALRERGVDPDPRYVRRGRHGRHIAHRLTNELLDLPEPPTAIFAGSDTQALGVLEAAGARRVEVPSQLSVVGFDDIDVAAYVGLTTVRQPLFDTGLRGGELLLAALAGTQPIPAGEVFPLELVARRTTGPVG